MLSFKQFNESQDKKHGPNTVVLVPGATGSHFTVKHVGDNLQRHLKPGETLQSSHVDDLHDMGYKVRYARDQLKKTTGPVSSGKAGVPQKD